MAQAMEVQSTVKSPEVSQRGESNITSNALLQQANHEIQNGGNQQLSSSQYHADAIQSGSQDVKSMLTNFGIDGLDHSSQSSTGKTEGTSKRSLKDPVYDSSNEFSFKNPTYDNSSPNIARFKDAGIGNAATESLTHRNSQNGFDDKTPNSERAPATDKAPNSDNDPSRQTAGARLYELKTGDKVVTANGSTEICSPNGQTVQFDGNGKWTMLDAKGKPVADNTTQHATLPDGTTVDKTTGIVGPSWTTITSPNGDTMTIDKDGATINRNGKQASVPIDVYAKPRDNTVSDTPVK